MGFITPKILKLMTKPLYMLAGRGSFGEGLVISRCGFLRPFQKTWLQITKKKPSPPAINKYNSNGRFAPSNSLQELCTQTSETPLESSNPKKTIPKNPPFEANPSKNLGFLDNHWGLSSRSTLPGFRSPRKRTITNGDSTYPFPRDKTYCN